MTYSIVALDPDTGELGVAVQSRWFSVGSVVPWVEAGTGAVATQSWTEPSYGHLGLQRIRDGQSAPDALAALVRADPDEGVRQVGMVDAAGRSAAHTGARCVRYASHLIAPSVAVQANMMERATVPAAMLDAFHGTGDDLASRLLAALRAAEAEGGDVRGRQSAALVVAPGPGSPGSSGDAPAPWARRFVLHVEDHRAPLDELARLLDVARAYELMDVAEEAAMHGDAERAAEARASFLTLAPDDGQVVLWSAVGLAMAGETDEARAAFARAAAVEPRSAEHLRRFAEAGHLPGGVDTLRRLGIE